MEIIQGHNNLQQLLEKIKGRQITIVTAFASKTVTTIEKMLKNGNKLTLIVGTINYFSDPVFIDQRNGRMFFSLNSLTLTDFTSLSTHPSEPSLLLRPNCPTS